MLAIVSPHGNLSPGLRRGARPRQWKHYEFALTPAAFGVTQEEFDLKMRDVIAVAIRSEWINWRREGGARQRPAFESSGSLLGLACRLPRCRPNSPTEAIAGKSADADQDGFSNWDEFVALTVPTDPLSRFEITGPFTAPVGSGSSIFSRSGRIYRVDEAGSFALGTWMPAGSLETGDDTIKSYIDAAAEPAAFFRVGVEMP